MLTSIIEVTMINISRDINLTRDYCKENQEANDYETKI